MASTVAARPAVPAAIPVRQLAPYAVFFGAVMFVLLYLVGAEQGAFSLIGGNAVHEFIHDGRHLLAFPCH
jgi:Probable cobalt transporter subunit (CbtB)